MDIHMQIQLDALAAHFGVKQDEDDPATATTRAEMKKQKDALVEALLRKGRAAVESAMREGVYIIGLSHVARTSVQEGKGMSL